MKLPETQCPQYPGTGNSRLQAAEGVTTEAEAEYVGSLLPSEGANASSQGTDRPSSPGLAY